MSHINGGIGRWPMSPNNGGTGGPPMPPSCWFPSAAMPTPRRPQLTPGSARGRWRMRGWICLLSLTALGARAVEVENKQAAPQPLPGGAPRGHLLELVKNPPLVQMLLPGFTVRELPLDLTNINNLLYRPDGKLYAVAYNGDILLLSDTNGDGLEDKADVFFQGKGRISGPVGIDITPDGHGVFIPSRGKVSLIVDRDRDGRADEEKIIAEGWPPARGGVDITGVVRDPRDGAIYFGLGARWYDNAYELDDKGVAHYSPKDARGGIQRIEPDFSKRAAICTGIRFPIALRFNEHGDLFCTDQEGATWLPNGNPFDELLHIERGRHYGFPPRHPKHVPDVIDEPSVFDFSPQHQSACGMNFNLPVNGGPIFGPAWWRGDAFIIGESRGKLWRTALAKTAHGYVADTQLLACLNQLAIDVCPGPRGDLTVCTHTGPPDWGTGPEGKGKLFKISWTDRGAPLPLAAWAEAPDRMVVAFDRPIDLESARKWLPEAKIERGRWVRAGDRFEGLRPPYDVVGRMMAEPRFHVAVHALQLSPDFRSVVFITDPQESATDHFALTLPGIDIGFTLGGVEAGWRSADGTSRRTGWLPFLDSEACAELAGNSPATGPIDVAKTDGTLTLRTKFDLEHMLQPAIQPGATLDYEYPPETVTVYLASNSQPFVVRRGGKSLASRRGHVAHDVSFTHTGGGLESIEIELPVNAGTRPHFTAAWHTAEDLRLRPFPRRRLFMPFVESRLKSDAANKLADAAVHRKITGGNWARGREVFFSEQAQCSKCHQVRGKGVHLGPDLSNVVHRDVETVRRDIRDPAATLNPDYLAFEVEMTDGTKIPGVPKLQSDGSWMIGLGAGTFLPAARADVKGMKPLPASIMPAGIDAVLGEEKFRDLLTFLLVEPPLMGEYASLPRDGVDHAPPPRTREEIDEVLADAPSSAPLPRLIRVVLVAGEKDHGKGEHDYPRWQNVWGRLLGMASHLELEAAWEWPTPEQWTAADVIVFFRKGDWSISRARDVDAHLARGRGLVYIHWAVEAGDQAAEVARRIGLASDGPKISWRHGPLDLEFRSDSNHPIIRNFRRVHFHDEAYWKLLGDPRSITTLATNIEENEPRPLFWTAERGEGKNQGRVFVSIPGHYSWTFDDPLFRILLFRGIAWAAKEPVDRFNNLIEAGIEP